MARCIQIAKNGLGATAPNPMVGSVVVYGDSIIGEGFTAAYGGPHAEVNAVASVKDKGLLKQARLYVTLEPCSHYGKTPPCADMIIHHQIPEVIIGIQDPHDKVAGKGIQKLREAGVKVTLGVLEQKCKEHHKRFLTFIGKRRPYIILKWAETQDGYIAPPVEERQLGKPHWITGKRSRQLAHQWRAEEQGILVGTQTALDDNPKLDVRHWKGEDPIRIVLDRYRKVPSNHHLLDGTIRTLVLTENSLDEESTSGNIQYVPIPYNGDMAAHICTTLYKEQIQSVLIEGGRQTLQTFIDAGLWDEARVFQGHTTFGQGIRAPQLKGRFMGQHQVGNDQLNIWSNG